MKERTKLLLILAVFAVAYYVPWGHPVIRAAGLESRHHLAIPVRP